MQHCQFFFNSSHEFFHNKIPINNILITTEFEHKYTKKLAKMKKNISNIIRDRSQHFMTFMRWFLDKSTVCTG